MSSSTVTQRGEGVNEDRCWVGSKACLCERLHVDDVDESEEERQPVLHPGHVGQEGTL